jgi:acetyl esterase/lipase
MIMKETAFVLGLLAPMSAFAQTSLNGNQAATQGQNAAVPPQPLTIEGAIPHIYKSIDGVELRLHVFNPPNQSASAKRAAIVFFFGGGFVRGNVEQFVPQSKQLAQHGIVAIVADYRVRNRHQTGPFEAIADAKSAIRWVRSHSVELGIDSNRIAAAGGSSGGRIALSAAVFDAFDEPGEDKKVSSKPNALVLFNPGVDDTANENVDRLFGARAREASPLHHITRGLPPAAIFHGKSDPVVAYSDAEQFCTEYSRAGNQCQLFGYEGATHGFFNPQQEKGKWYRITLSEVERFLTALGYLPEPTRREIE